MLREMYGYCFLHVDDYMKGIANYKSQTAHFDISHRTRGINFLFHSVNPILFTRLLVHLILHITCPPQSLSSVTTVSQLFTIQT